MAYLLIHCECCGGHWEVYGNTDYYDSEKRKCPHCGQRIQTQTWDKFIVPALGQVMDANTELAKDHTGMHTALFSVDVIADHLYANRHQQCKCELVEQLQAFEDFIHENS